MVLEVHPKRPPHFARAEATRTQSLDHHRQPLQRGLGGGRPGAQHDRFRRLHRNRRRHRWAGARFRSLVDQARQTSFGDSEEGPDRAGGDSQYRFVVSTACRSASSNCSRMPGKATSRTIRWAISYMGGSAAWPVSADFVELAEGVEGLCHFSEVPGYSGRRGSEEPPLTVGQELDFKIIKMSEAEKKIGLSLRAVTDDEEKDPSGRLPAPGGGRHHHHRRSDEPQRSEHRVACKFVCIQAILRFRNLIDTLGEMR